jgi:hypothetical protein
MKLGYIRKHNLELNPQLTKRFEFRECTFTRRISGKSDRVYCKLIYPVDYEELIFNAELMEKNPGLIVVNEPFLLNDELREKAIKWVEWANHADPEEYDPFAKITKTDTEEATP